MKEAAEAKIEAFIEMLGNDARLLTDGEEVKSHDLFRSLTSKKTITGEDEEQQSELEYLNVIKEIRESNPDLFERIKKLPKKARSAKKGPAVKSNSVLTYFRKGKLEKFYISTLTGEANELDFFDAVGRMKAKDSEKREKVEKDFYTMLERNKDAFILSTTEEMEEKVSPKGRDAARQILQFLKSNNIKHYKGFTDDDEGYLAEVIKLVEEGALPKQTLKTLLQALSKEINPMKILGELKLNIPQEFFQQTVAESAAATGGPREVILSEYIIAN